ncbi:MAG: hypothetical protein E5Y61_25140 [Mesorhizobium sp.]|nr:MAG: hypothetical protein E5Y61_25140 [Mesorhizobium sp.]
MDWRTIGQQTITPAEYLVKRRVGFRQKMKGLEDAQAHGNRGSIMAETETVPTIGPADQQSEERAFGQGKP